MKELTRKELLDLPDLYDYSYPVVNRWLARGDGVAVYVNQDMGHPELGHHQYVSFGSPAAQLEVDVPPQTLPDIGLRINWRYKLYGIYKGEAL